MSIYKPVDREAVWAALFALLNDKLCNQFKTIGRRLVQPPMLSPEQQPALFVVQQRETRSPRPAGTRVKVTLVGYLILYFNAPQPGSEAIGRETKLGATEMNCFLQALDEALAPDNVATGKLTLDGLVEHCWIEGDVDMDVGMYSSQGAAAVPIKILVP